MTKKILNSRYFLLAILSVVSALVLTLAHMSTAYELPPRGDDTGQEAAVPDPALPVGARLQLHAQFDDSWPWDEMHWQKVWTEVQWADAEGNWYLVEGWGGNLDDITQETGWVGTKEWWVGAEHLGSGPYRWLIYASEGGKLLAVSDPFYLPDISGGVLAVEQELAP